MGVGKGGREIDLWMAWRPPEMLPNGCAGVAPEAPLGLAAALSATPAVRKTAVGAQIPPPHSGGSGGMPPRPAWPGAAPAHSLGPPGASRPSLRRPPGSALRPA